jgi:sugar/nucleoside kinase (ribokinase family)
MPTAAYDVAGIGNAIVDILCFTDDAFLTSFDMKKGGMTLIDEARAIQVYKAMGPGRECSGGSVANSMAGLASLGAQCAFVGKVRDDQLGEIFRHDMRSIGVTFDTGAAGEGPGTARCLILVTPDAQRTMNTYLGACSGVAEMDIDSEIISSASITYIEGYLWDQPGAKAAIRKAMQVSRKAGKKIAFTLSDTFCVDRHRTEFLDLIRSQVDILFANESEVKSLFKTENFDFATAQLKGKCALAAITRSEKGCVVLTAQGSQAVPTDFVPQVVDSTGAGDLFAAGFLFGLTRGWDLGSCATLGNRCAGEIITQLGARSEKPLKRLVA